jgi:hypothetical protein
VKEGHYRLVVAIGGGVTELIKKGRKRSAGEKKNNRRGTCRGFTRWSRRRFAISIQQLNRSRVVRAFFVTLTEPEGATDWSSIERHRRAYFERFRRQWGERATVYWKKEPHESGTPHLHLLVFWSGEPPRWREFIRWNDPAWGDVTDNAKLHVACNVKWLRSWNGVAFYVAKYFGKLVEDPGAVESTGRIWGIFNRAVRSRLVELVEDELSPEVGRRCVRVLRKLQARKRRRLMVSKSRLRAGQKIKWKRLRALRDGIGGQVLTPDQAVLFWRDLGHRVSLFKPRVMYTRSVPVWVEVEEKGRVRIELRKEAEGGSHEKESVCSSHHFVASDEVVRLVSFIRGQVVQGEKLRAALPF